MMFDVITVTCHGQYVRKRKKFFAHDEGEQCSEGDWVIIKECRPLTQHKHFNVVEIVERAQRSTPNSEPSIIPQPNFKQTGT